MSRSGYSDDLDSQELNMWRGAVNKALNGKRGQAFLKELLESLDSLPKPRLVQNAFVEDGDVCALGSVGVKRALDMEGLEDCREETARVFGIASAMVAEIEFINDDDFYYNKETPEQRFVRVRKWVEEHIRA